MALAWAWEMVQHSWSLVMLNLFQINCFQAQHKHTTNDIFNTEKLENVILPHADVVPDDVNIVSERRAKLCKYSSKINNPN